LYSSSRVLLSLALGCTIPTHRSHDNRALPLPLSTHQVSWADEAVQVEEVREGHAVVELDAVHHGVVKVKPLQLQGQQVRKFLEL